MASGEINQEANIAAAEAAKLIATEGATISQLRGLRKNIDEKRKALARPMRVEIKEIDQLFAGPLQQLKDRAQALDSAKSE